MSNVVGTGVHCVIHKCKVFTDGQNPFVERGVFETVSGEKTQDFSFRAHGKVVYEGPDTFTII